MQTFEQRFKEEFKTMLSKFIDEEIVVSNDISHDALVNNSDAVVTVIKSALGQASAINNFDLINTTFTVNFLINANYLQKLLGALNSLIWNYNAVWANLTIPIYDISKSKLDDKLYIYRPVFSTPTQLGGLSKLATKTRTISTASVVFNFTVGYSSNADLKPDDFYLVIDNTPYKINPIRYNMSSAPTYEPDMIVNEKFSKQDYSNESVAFEFTFLKTIAGRDALIDVLSAQFLGNDFLSGKDLRLRRSRITENGNAEIEYIDISSHVVEEIYENGMKSIRLTLLR